MCCCIEPSVNGTPNAYSWDGKTTGTRPVAAPDVNPAETVLVDEPGRCGNGVGDCHSHHFTVVKGQYGEYALLVRHGGGDERIPLGTWAGRAGNIITTLTALDSNARYALLHTIHSVARDAGTFARNREAHMWQMAAAAGRIKTRKQRNSQNVKVWIEPATA